MTDRLYRLRDWASLARTALSRGGTIKSQSPNIVEWDAAGRCSQPIYREIVGREDLTPIRRGVWSTRRRGRAGPRHTIELWVRCRKCPACLRARSAHWRMRVVAELSASPGRSWFGTITLSPHHHSMMLFRARARLRARGTIWEGLSEAEQYAERLRETGRELTLWMKRVRKESNATLRYCLVAEQHKSGLPHYHIVVHEVDGPVTHRTLSNQWALGFTKFNVVAHGDEAKTARYVAKYLTKAASCRIRASAFYGSPTHHVLNITTPPPGGSCVKRNDDLQRCETFLTKTGALAPIAKRLELSDDIRISGIEEEKRGNAGPRLSEARPSPSASGLRPGCSVDAAARYAAQRIRAASDPPTIWSGATANESAGDKLSKAAGRYSSPRRERRNLAPPG